MPPHLDQRETLNQNMNIQAQTRDDDNYQKAGDVVWGTNSTADVSVSHSSHEVQALHLKPSLSCDTGCQLILQTTSSASNAVSIGSPRSVFVPVNQSPQHVPNERNHKLLPPNSPNLSNLQDIIRNKGVVEKWQNLEKSNKLAGEMKSKPVEYRFRPIAQSDEQKFSNVEVHKSVLSSKARKRKHVPFTHIIIRDDDSCTTVSSISCNSSDFDVDVLYSFAAKYQHTTIEAHKELLQETNELIERISRHNLDKVVIEEAPEIKTNEKSEVVKVGGTVDISKIDKIDHEKLLEDTNHLLDEIDEQPLASAISGPDNLDEFSDPSIKIKRPPASILQAMDNDFSNVEKRQDLPEIDALVVDNDLSFDDLREDPDPPTDDFDASRPPGKSTMETSLFEKSKAENFFSDDEGLSLISADKNETPAKGTVQNAIEMLGFEEMKPQTKEEIPTNIRNFKDPKEKIRVKVKDDNADAFADLVEMMNPRMNEKAQLHKKPATGDDTSTPELKKDSEQKYNYENKIPNDDDDSEQGGIAIIIQNLEKKGKRCSKLEEDEKQTHDDFPIKEIFIPTIQNLNSDNYPDPFYKTAKPMKKASDASRVRTKQDNDTRIQSIMRRGKDRFLNRWNRNKVPPANE